MLKTGIAGRRIERIEAGADPSLAELRQLAELCGTSPVDIVSRAARPAGSPRAGVDNQQFSADLSSKPGVVPPVVRLVAPVAAVRRVTTERSGRVVLNKVMFARNVLGPLAA